MSLGRTWWASVLALTAAALIAAALGGWQLHAKNRTLPPLPAEQPTSAPSSAARQAAITAARTGAVKVLSYSPATLEQDFAAAKATLTGAFLSYYDQFTKDIVAPAARDKGVTAKAEVQRAGVVTQTEDAATILVFIKQTTTRNDQPEPTLTSSAVNAGLVKVNGAWLINKFDPV
jgi:Mce-associated membrane protein